MSIGSVLETVKEYYNQRIKKYGPTPAGVDWNSLESQELRFQCLLRICDASRRFSINDYGCGYGALVDYMTKRGYSFDYCGFDISPEMIGKAKALHNGMTNCEFFDDERHLRKADYTIASGIFNVKLQIDAREWEVYVTNTLDRIAHMSERGFSFNALTKYCDRERMRPDLYYADPLFLFDYCIVNFSRHVSLLHDYPLYEFTILVRM